jgi:prolipoprotein diacylglyceryltransferase
MIGAAVLLGVIFWLARSWKHRHYGQLFAFWIIWYGVQRFLIDFARLGAARDGLTLPDGRVVDGVIADGVMGPFTGSQWGALLAAILGVALFAYFARTRPVVSEAADVAYGADRPDIEAESAADEDEDSGLFDVEPAGPPLDM